MIETECNLFKQMSLVILPSFVHHVGYLEYGS